MTASFNDDELNLFREKMAKFEFEHMYVRN
jgi:hypothetical protein